MPRITPRQLAVKYLQFNAVGAVGVIVQLALLSLFYHGFGWHYLLATVLAVELTVIHNFFWHEKWTWKERCRGSSRDSWSRLIRFNVTNGFISIAGNIVFMKILVELLGSPVVFANFLTILCCSLLNFAVSHRYVFSSE